MIRTAAARMLSAAPRTMRMTVRPGSSVTPSPFHALIIGPPGGGKGTISKRIVRDFGPATLSTGDMIRAQIAAKTDLGLKFQELVAAGQLVPADVVMALLDAELGNYADKDWMLDGFPRSLEQAALLDSSQRIDFVLHIDVPFDIITERLTQRLCHMESGRIYNLQYNPPKVEGLDDETGEPLVQREDDKPETVMARLELYNEETKPLLDHYDSKGLLKTFTGTESDVIYPMVSEYMSSNLGIPKL